MLTVNFVTTNSHKFAVAKHFFSNAGLLDMIELRQYSIETPEVQADSTKEVAANSAKWVANELQQAVVVADAGLGIAALNGFPGPYMKYINQTLDSSDLLSLMQNKTDRNANFTDALAYYDPRSQELQVFESITHGTIANDPSNNDGPTTDRLFVPAGHDKPLADIPEDERTKVWNTDRWQHLVDFLRSRTN